MSMVIAVDGPSGSGKSSVSKAVAAQLGLRYLDTGAMYRALAWACADAGIDLGDADAVASACRDLDLRMGTDPDAPFVAVGERGIDAEIRTTEVSSVVSKVATNLDVRANMKARQREIITAAADSGPGIVAEGRDITTVVAPDAQVRLLLTADPDARLSRRTTELHGEASAEGLAATADQIHRRDAEDSTVSQFTVAADGVVTLDSTYLDFDQTVAAVLAVVAQVTGSTGPTGASGGDTP